jgi:N-acetylmuramate 1-kinase
VPHNIKDDILKSYSESDKAWMRVLATQFHCRVIGQFIKLAAKSHKTGYLQYIPVVQGHMRAALKDPLLAPLKAFFEESNINFDTPPDLKDIKFLVSPDAF